VNGGSVLWRYAFDILGLYQKRGALR